MPEAATRIGIAIVEHAGRFLVGVRGDGSPLSGKAEFPGGKCHENESPAECAVRECLEETGWRSFRSGCWINGFTNIPTARWNSPFGFANPFRKTA
jgi:8-oxo-dGTP pyrophosphatase MutT (NUDIX family)